MKLLSMNTAKQKEYMAGVALIAAGPLFILGTNPDQLPLLMLLVPYVLGFLALFVLGRMALSSLGVARSFSVYKQNVFVGTFAAMPILLLILQSLRQFTIRDLALVGALGVGTLFYLMRADFLK